MIVLQLASVGCFVAGVSLWMGCTAAVLALAALLMLWRSVSKPIHSVYQGMYLLAEQDYASRLRPVGEPVADHVVKFYNLLIDNMKSERLKLQEQNKLLDQVITASPTGIALCRLDRSISVCNPAYQRLRTPETDAVIERLDPGMSQVCHAGHGQILRCSRTAFVDQGFRRSFVMIEQLTDEIVEAEQQLFGRIIRIISHEVNNSLSAPRSVLESLRALYPDDELLSRAIDSSIQACDNLAAFTRRYARAVKLPEPEFRPLDLQQLVADMLPRLQQICTGITLRTANRGKSSIVMADNVLLERVIVNIVTNSAESIGCQGGQITVTTGPDSLEISDNGPGITAETSRHLFQPFFTTKPSGHGLGLMLCAAILRAHHAQFSLATTDGITRFSINFNNNSSDKE